MPGCACTFEAGDSPDCPAHPTCAECGDPGTRNGSYYHCRNCGACWVAPLTLPGLAAGLLGVCWAMAVDCMREPAGSRERTDRWGAASTWEFGADPKRIRTTACEDWLIEQAAPPGCKPWEVG